MKVKIKEMFCFSNDEEICCQANKDKNMDDDMRFLGASLSKQGFWR